MKTIKVSAVVYEMLQELSKNKKLKPILLIDKLVEQEYFRK